MSIENRLPIPLTADGVPVGIGDTVYAIWNEVRRNTRGKFYRASTIAVYPVKISSIRYPCQGHHRLYPSGSVRKERRF